MDGGMPELYAHILAENRRPYDDVFFGGEIWTLNKALVRMNYGEIADCLLENVKYPVHLSSDFYSKLEEILQRVRQHWLQRLDKGVEEFGGDIRDVLYLSWLEDWDIKNYGLRAGNWEFMNWNENPFQNK